MADFFADFWRSIASIFDMADFWHSIALIFGMHANFRRCYADFRRWDEKILSWDEKILIRSVFKSGNYSLFADFWHSIASIFDIANFWHSKALILGIHPMAPIFDIRLWQFLTLIFVHFCRTNFWHLALPIFGVDCWTPMSSIRKPIFDIQ